LLADNVSVNPAASAECHFFMSIRKRTICLTIAVVGVVGLGLIGTFWQPAPLPRDPDSQRRQTQDNTNTKPAPLTRLSKSDFLNTAAGVGHVGSQACRECHEDEWQSYQDSGMAHSMHRTDLAQDPAPQDPAAPSPAGIPSPGTVQHAASGRRYQSLWRDGKLLHREELVAGDGPPVLLGEHEMQFVVGSGIHFTMYLGEIDGFLVESPLTWYSGKPGWDMSPGYAVPFQLGFQREITADCLFCHAGQAAAIDGSYHRIKVTELAIGCERCHGPGTLHVKRHSSNDPSGAGAEDFDHTIVNPAHLSRDRAEAICHQCHLQSRSYTSARGRSLADFRPGLALEDFQHYYRSSDPGEQMKVVGHTEQLLLSRCYTESKTLSCMTCHNPHGRLPVSQRDAGHRQSCLNCHDTGTCKEAAPNRQQTKPPDNCLACHMPTVQTSTLHVAVTHHRIGIHRDNAPTPSRTEDLEPIHDLSRFSHADQVRSLGLAYLKRVFQLGIESGPESRRLWDHSLKLLLQSQREGLNDPEVHATLAQLLFQKEPDQAVSHARIALKQPKLSIEPRLNALFALSSHHQSRQQPELALGYLDELIRLRRSASDWELRALCLLQKRDLPATIKALETAIGINPELLSARDLLARLYKNQQQFQRADNQKKLLRRMAERRRSRGRP